jgi:hypothetical protein
MSWRHWMRGGTGCGDRGSSGDCGDGVLAGAAGAARGCWGGMDGLRSTRGRRNYCKMLPHTSDNPSNLILPTDPTKEYKESLIKTLLPIESHIPLHIYCQLYPT